MADFRIVVDSREQQPYSFSCPAVRKALPAGDYSVEGYETRVAVERKSLADFTATVIHDFARFSRELEKLAIYDAAAIVVEADLDEMLRGMNGAQLHNAKPASVLGAALHIGHEYGVPVHWCGSRQAAREFTEQYLRMFVRAMK